MLQKSNGSVAVAVRGSHPESAGWRSRARAAMALKDGEAPSVRPGQLEEMASMAILGFPGFLRFSKISRISRISRISMISPDF